jgi:hypothetical protein
MHRKYLLILSALFLGFSACKKKAEEIKDCEKNNYGVVTVTFTSTANRHSILINYPGTAYSRDEIVPKGQASDTVHLPPNTVPYSFSISSLDDGGAAIDQSNKTSTVSKCSEATLSVNF